MLSLIYSDAIGDVYGDVYGDAIGDAIGDVTICCLYYTHAPFFWQHSNSVMFLTQLLTVVADSVKAQPSIQVSPNVFKMTLSNLNYQPNVDNIIVPEERITQYVYDNGSINRKEAEHLLGLSQTATGVLLSKLVKQGDLVREGQSRNVRYFAGKGCGGSISTNRLSSAGIPC